MKKLLIFLLLTIPVLSFSQTWIGGGTSSAFYGSGYTNIRFGFGAHPLIPVYTKGQTDSLFLNVPTQSLRDSSLKAINSAWYWQNAALNTTYFDSTYFGPPGGGAFGNPITLHNVLKTNPGEPTQDVFGPIVFKSNTFYNQPLHLQQIQTNFIVGSTWSHKVFIGDTANHAIATFITNNHETNLGGDTINHGLTNGLFVPGNVRLTGLASITPTLALTIDGSGNVGAISISSTFLTLASPNQTVVQTPFFQNGFTVGANINWGGFSLTNAAQIQATSQIVSYSASSIFSSTLEEGDFNSMHPTDYLAEWGGIGFEDLINNGTYHNGMFVYKTTGGSPLANLVVSSASDVVFMTNGVVTPQESMRIMANGNIIVPSLPAYSSGGNLNIVLNSTTGRFETSAGGGSGITALTGDVTASGSGSVAATLATVNSNVGSFGDATHVPAITVNAKGLTTAVTSTAITFPVTLANTVALTNKDLTGSGNTFPTLNQNTTGTALNITATSNSTLTTLSALSLPYSQLTGAPAIPTAANPTATAGVSFVNGTATTFMRSDAAPKVDSTVFQTILNFKPLGNTYWLLKGATTLPASFTASSLTSFGSSPTLVTPTLGVFSATSGTFAAGTTSVAPIVLTSGTDLTSATAGSFEFNGTRLAFSPSTTRKRVTLTNDATPTNGQIPIGNGTDYTVASITGTASQITVTPGAGTITLSTPQNINTTASPVFGQLGLGASASGSARLLLAAGTTSISQMRYTTGVAPTSPISGDTWRVSASQLQFYDGSATNNFVFSQNSQVIILGSTQTTLVLGTKALSITGVTTSSHAYATLVTQGGTSTAVYSYSAVCTSGTVTVTAETVAGVTVTTDTSLINVFITN
jgi:hypothetical protein